MRQSALALAALFSLSGCLKQLALGSVADALSGQGTTFSGDDDPELVADAIPFALKTMEALMPNLPEHDALRVSACSGFTQYAFAFVLQPAKLSGSFAQEKIAAARAKALFLRARGYCLEALELRHAGFKKAVTDDKTTFALGSPLVAALNKDDVEALYWLAASTALSITSVKEQVDMLGHLPVVDVLIKRSLELDPDWDKGTLQELVISWDGGRSETMGGSPERARAAFKRAVELSEGKKAGPYVSLAESVSIDQQNRKEFEELLGKALAVDVNAAPQYRLTNVLAQRRAQKLLAQIDDLILGEEAP